MGVGADAGAECGASRRDRFLYRAPNGVGRGPVANAALEQPSDRGAHVPIRCDRRRRGRSICTKIRFDVTRLDQQRAQAERRDFVVELST